MDLWYYFILYLLQIVLYCGDSAQALWDKLKAIFQDDKHTRAVYLENQFNSLHLSNFFDVSTYCTKLKSLKDQLANIDQPVSEQKFVLRLVSSHNEIDFDVVATIIIQHTEPLPSFESAKSRLLLEESHRDQDFITQTSTIVAQGPPTAADQPPWWWWCGCSRGSAGRGHHTSTQQQQQSTTTSSQAQLAAPTN